MTASSAGAGAGRVWPESRVAFLRDRRAVELSIAEGAGSGTIKINRKLCQFPSAFGMQENDYKKCRLAGGFFACIAVVCD